MKRLCVFVFWASLLLVIGCSYNVNIRPNLDVTTTIANQLDFRVGVYIPPEVKGMKMSDRADWANKYTFNVGEAVSSIISKALSRVFKYCEILEAYPTETIIAERRLDLVATARITEANAALRTQQGFWAVDASGNVQISANLIFLEPNLIQFTSIQATGAGMANESVDLLSTGQKEYTVPVESAIRNLGNNIVQQVYGNYDIRKRAENKK
jgi:hypothetical protein